MNKKYPFKNLGLANLKGEKWKDIPGLELYAQVSNFGRIKRLAYELEYIDGRIFRKPARIIKPVVTTSLNNFNHDHLFFLRVTITLFRRKYNFTPARLVYHCFKKPFDLTSDAILILAKDHDGLNLKPSNLIQATLSQRQKRMFSLHRRTPFVMDEENRRKSLANARLANNKPVTQYDLKGKKINTFPSIAVASRQTGISESHISGRARGIENTAGGFIWRLGKAVKIDITPMHEKIREIKEKNKEIFGKKVSQYSMDGKRLAIFPTVNDAGKATGIYLGGISMAVNQKLRSAGGFYWQEGYGPSHIDLSHHIYGKGSKAKERRRPVMQYSNSGKPIRKFDSITDAARAVGVSGGSITGALKGKQITSAGYKWKYL